MLYRCRTFGQGQKTRGRRRKMKAGDATSDLFAYEAHPWTKQRYGIPLGSEMVESVSMAYAMTVQEGQDARRMRMVSTISYTSGSPGATDALRSCVDWPLSKLSSSLPGDLHRPLESAPF